MKGEKPTENDYRRMQIQFARGWNSVVNMIRTVKEGNKKFKRFFKDSFTEKYRQLSRKKNWFDQSYCQGIQTAIKFLEKGKKPRLIKITEAHQSISAGNGRNWHGLSKYYDNLMNKDHLSEKEFKYLEQVRRTIK